MILCWSWIPGYRHAGLHLIVGSLVTAKQFYLGWLWWSMTRFFMTDLSHP